MSYVKQVRVSDGLSVNMCVNSTVTVLKRNWETPVKKMCPRDITSHDINECAIVTVLKRHLGQCCRSDMFIYYLQKSSAVETASERVSADDQPVHLDHWSPHGTEPSPSQWSVQQHVSKRWARSWSRCTGSQPAECLFKSSSLPIHVSFGYLCPALAVCNDNDMILNKMVNSAEVVRPSTQTITPPVRKKLTTEE